ncbi:MAG: hypothetical protein KKF48_02025 [Nanoarchaeota archaeon]|nr:hypothetical protein [Nanoarchaeota archaeon]MBU1027798.1 hypothetical protein [Nanoarchaeota archaeon]
MGRDSKRLLEQVVLPVGAGLISYAIGETTETPFLKDLGYLVAGIGFLRGIAEVVYVNFK